MSITLTARASLIFALICGSAFAATVPVVPNGLSGVVASTKGPEAGVWVIAETHDLPTRLIKIVVTDDAGRYVIPELPKANYKVWVRGYGLVDSKPVQTSLGKKLDLTAVVAPHPRAAAEYYPANYWFSLLKPPATNEFPGTGINGNGIPEVFPTQQSYLAEFMEGCMGCHQIGASVTRTTDTHTLEGWLKRIQRTQNYEHALGKYGIAGSHRMVATLAHLGFGRTTDSLIDWGKRIAEGEVPPAPPRPHGIERNVVLTVWDWANGRFAHDIALTDRRNPQVAANGPIYGSGFFTGTIPVLDPLKNEASEILIPGHNKVHDITASPHTDMLDAQGRVWMGGGTINPESQLPDGSAAAQPAFCTDPSNPYASYFPVAEPSKNTVGRENHGYKAEGQSGSPRTGTVMVYDPKTDKTTVKTVCFLSHHLHFSRKENDTVYFSGDERVIGWVDTKKWDETHGDASKSTGWCPMVVDTNGDGQITPDRTQWNEPQHGAPVATDPKKDSRFEGFPYGIENSPVDDSMWFVRFLPQVPSGVFRFVRGANPPQTCRTEYFEAPRRADGSYAAVGARGVTVDTQGVVWVSYSTGQLGRFDRRLCKSKDTHSGVGQQCPEGWSFLDAPGPKLKGVKEGTADFSYLVWADWFNVSGLGKDTILFPGSNSDSLLALQPGSKDLLTFRVPYPRGFYTRNVEGRIDDPKAGWKGRGLWSTYSLVPVWQQEGGNGPYQGGGSKPVGPELVKFQIRPDPLAF